MFLEAPGATDYDLRFQIAGIPVRISPWFWLMTIMLGVGPSEQGQPALLLLWAIAVSLSILIHELGHSLAFRYYGIDSQIVLYQFGGLAIPTGRFGSTSRRMLAKRHQSLVIAAAGPAAQLLAALVLIVGIRASGFGVPLYGFLTDWMQIPSDPLMPSERLFYFCSFFLDVSIYWAILNLLPVFPLDGGQISRELFLLWDRIAPIKHALMVSVVTAGLCVLFALKHEQFYLGIMFGMLGYSSYLALQSHSGPGGGFGSRWR